MTESAVGAINEVVVAIVEENYIELTQIRSTTQSLHIMLELVANKLITVDDDKVYPTSKAYELVNSFIPNKQ